LRHHDFYVIFAKLEHEIVGKPSWVPFYLLPKSPRLDAVEFGQVLVQHDMKPTKGMDFSREVEGGEGLAVQRGDGLFVSRFHRGGKYIGVFG
jgi:hypothetical protein